MASLAPKLVACNGRVHWSRRTCDADLAAAYGHLTAAQAARLAVEAGARRLVLTHFSQRYPDDAAFAAEAGEIFPKVVVVKDLDRVPVPPRAG